MIRIPKAQASREVWGHARPETFEIEKLWNAILRILLEIIISFSKINFWKSQNTKNI